VRRDWARAVIATLTASAALTAGLALEFVARPGPASAAASGRALELVTPNEPVTASVHDVGSISNDGGRISYMSFGPMPGAISGDLVAYNFASRGDSGWVTSPVGYPFMVEKADFVVVRQVALSEDMSTSVWQSKYPLTPDAPPAPNLGLYRRSLGGETQFLANLGIDVGEPVIGISRDAETVVFAVSGHLLPSDAGREDGRKSIYKVVGTDLQQVDVNSEGNLLSVCGAMPLSGASQFLIDGAVSESGDRIFFTTEPCSTPEAVYMRAGDTTVKVSESQCDRPDCNPEQAATFVGATSSGAIAFIASGQQLTNDDTDERRDLYRYDVATGVLHLLSDGPDEESGGVTEQPIKVSADGTRVYFDSVGRLLPGEGSEDSENLYLADATGLHFIAPHSGHKEFQISADGRIAILATRAPLVGSDADENSDIYRFDADDLSLTQLSTGNAGGNGPLDAALDQSVSLVQATGAHRVLSPNGERLFFSTKEALLSSDVNKARDVYEWHGGTLGLLSQGAGPDDAMFMGVSGDGGTAIFRTAASLLPSDGDGGDFDLYAARIGGGFAEEGSHGGCGARCEPPESPSSRLGRPVPATATTRKPPAERLRLRGLTHDAIRRLSVTGRIALTVSVPKGGRVSARASSTLDGHEQTVASTSVIAGRRGLVPIVLGVNRAARRALSARRLSRIELVIRQSDLRLVRSFNLRTVVG
jgi:hypothetical protein